MYRRKTMHILCIALRVYPPPPAAPQGPQKAAGFLPAQAKEAS